MCTFLGYEKGMKKGTLWMINQSKISNASAHFTFRGEFIKPIEVKKCFVVRSSAPRSNSYGKLDNAALLTRIEAFGRHNTYMYRHLLFL
jgi:hypothetical protein